jgi:hypothetical protein
MRTTELIQAILVAAGICPVSAHALLDDLQPHSRE